MAASPSPTPTSDADDHFPIGSVLDGRYRICAVLGTGGMGRVYRAEHTEAGKSVAIKVLHAELTKNREASQRFKREVVASRRLDHPNIVEVSDAGVLDDGACYLVMEVLEGESLGDRLIRERRLHWVEALDILRGVLRGLRHAHDNGVVHRDIKPDNIYLTHKAGELVIKILDFGIAKLYAGTADDPASTRAGLTVGTPAYLSPEQAVGGEITPASDMYSASIVLYEMLAGRAPFEDKDPLAMLGAHVSRPAPRLSDIAPGVDIPAELEAIVQHGLRKPAAERIRTATEYLARIDAFSPPLPSPRSAHAAAGSKPGSKPAAPARVARVSRTSEALRATAVSSARPALPRAAQAVALGGLDDPTLLTWILRSGVVFGLVFIAAIALAITAHCSGPERALKAPGTRAEAGEAGNPGSTAKAGAKTDPPAPPAPPAPAEAAEGRSPTEAGSAADPRTERVPPPSAAEPVAAPPRPTPIRSAPPAKRAQGKSLHHP
ncbi:MAG TPA: protein kinase [Kofleriaceae bacterium]